MSKSKVKKGIYWRGGVLWIRYAGPGGKIFKKSAHTTSVRKAEELLNSKKGQVANFHFAMSVGRNRNLMPTL